MDDYNSNFKDCPYNMPIMGISPKGIHFIGRRYQFNDPKNSANGASINVSRLDPITGKIIGTINLVKWKPFIGDFETKRFNMNEFLNNFGRNREKVEPVKSVTPNEKKYGFPDAIMVGKALKKYKISSGVAYRWMHENILEYRMVGKNRYVPRSKFAELAANHADKRRGKPKKKVAASPVITYTPVTSKHPWWKFWK